MAERKGRNQGEKPRSLRAPEEGPRNPNNKNKNKKGNRNRNKNKKPADKDVGAVSTDESASSENTRKHSKCPRKIVGRAMRCFYDKAFDDANKDAISVDCKVRLTPFQPCSLTSEINPTIVFLCRLASWQAR